MASSNDSPSLFQCTECKEELNFESKTLPCLHSLCHSCLGRNFAGETDGHCPECHEPLTIDQLSLSQILIKSLKCKQLESTELKCNLCMEDGINSTARFWCQDCQKLHCDNCNRLHNKFKKDFNLKHTTRDLDGMERGELIKAMMIDMCSLHGKSKDSYCKRCNVCLCDTCYQKHSTDFPGCSSQPLSVREEALKQKSQGPSLDKEMDDFVKSLRSLNERSKNYTDELNSDCDSKCKQLWEDLEKMIENAKRETRELCEDMQLITAEQVKMWRHLIKENENILKQLEIWRLNLRHLLNESQQDVDVVYGFRLLGLKLSSQREKSPIGPEEEKCQLGVTFPNWWLNVLEQLKTEKIGSVSLKRDKLPAINFIFDTQWNLCGSNPWITSIHVSKGDGHVFLSDWCNDSIMEFTESGHFVCQCHLFQGTKKFSPNDLCSISSDLLIVACGYENKLIILERRKNPPFLQIKQIIHTKNKIRSVCQINDLIFGCDIYLQVDSFTNEGKQIKTIKTGRESGRYLPRIRADPSNGNFWERDLFSSSEIFYFNSKGDKIGSLKIEENISDFCMNKFGDLYFCKKEGIFSFSPKKMLYKFEKESEVSPKMFVSKNKMFVYLRIDGKDLMKIFKIFY